MGGFSAQVQQPTNPPDSGGGKGIASSVNTNPPESGGGKGIASSADEMYNAQYNPAPQPMAKGGNYQSNATSGQPRMGRRNMYPNTVGQWDNAQIQPIRQQGKGKGA